MSVWRIIELALLLTHELRIALCPPRDRLSSSAASSPPHGVHEPPHPQTVSISKSETRLLVRYLSNPVTAPY